MGGRDSLPQAVWFGRSSTLTLKQMAEDSELKRCSYEDEVISCPAIRPKIYSIYYISRSRYHNLHAKQSRPFS